MKTLTLPCTCMHAKSLHSCPNLCDPMNSQAPLSMGFSRQEYWNGLPYAPPGDLPNPGIKPMFPVSPVLAVRFFSISDTWEALYTPLLIRKSDACRDNSVAQL